MELGSPPNTTPLKPRDRVVRRLVNIGVPEEFLNYSGLVTFTKDNVSRIPDIVSAILPLDDEVAEVIREAKAGNKRVSLGPNMKHRYRESMVWLQWLMFKGEPDKALKRLSRIGHHGVCGAVWGYNDIAYKCRTCEHDPTCAICVSCFQNGNHKDHDYSITYSSTGGCCDCGDVTALNYEGFCSKHKGAEQIQPLPEKFANSVGPVLDALLICWKNKLSFAEIYGQENSRVIDTVSELRKAANELTFALVEMLLEFCKNSESLLGFISKSVTALAGLLEILVRAERFLSEVVVRKLHELLLKLLREPVFKYEFAKVFLGYYPDCVNEAIRECSDNAKNRYPLQSTFSVQIFMVPTLTPRLVKEMNLLEMLLGCLFDIFISCAGEDGCLQVKKWANLYYTTIRVITDICFVMSHLAVSKYATHYQTGVSKIWMKILAFVQGMNPHKRETGIHVKEENEFVSYPLDLDNCIANIQPFWVDGALSFSGSEETNDDFNMKDVDYGGSLGNAKVGHLSQESFVCDAMRRSSQSDCASKATDVMYEIVYDVLVPPAVMSLIHECLREMENWLGINENTSACLQDVPSPNTNSISGSNFLALKKTLSRFQKGKHIFSRLTGSSEVPAACISNSRAMVSGESDLVASCSAGSNGGGMEGEDLHVLSLCHWPDIIYDVSLQDISVHIPLHRLLSLTLQKALRRCYGETAAPKLTGSESENSLSAVDMDFFGHVLGRCHPYGFSAFVMEHPLRIRVFCAQVHAGMWHKNGDTALSSFEWYRSQRWSEQGLELDLFLLQCCAALSPPNLFVHRIIERFGLLHYLSLLPECLSEYEPVLVKEMLTLMIQVIQERRFCGLRTAESLKRELVHNLAIGDATHSQLVKSLPRDLSKFDQLQEILDSVAMFSNPSDFNQGMYSLRLPCWKELDLYHSCWSLRDFQVAEERYLQFCSVSAMTTQLPRWTKIYHPLEGIASIATCEVILKLIRAVLFYAVFSDKMMEPRTPYSVLITALHLLALALDICFQKRKPGDQSCGDSIPLLALAAEEIPDGLLWGAGNQSLLSLLVLLMRTHKKDNLNNFMEAGHCTISSLIESLLKKFAEIDSRCMTKLQQLAPEVVSHLSCPPSGATVSCSDSDSEKHKEKVRERQAAILEKIKAEQNKFLSSISTNADNDSKSKPGVSNSNLDHDSEESVQDVCSLCHDPNSTTPVSYLILLQKSRLLSFVDRVPPSWDQAHRLSKGNCSMITDRMADQLGTNSSSSAQMAGNAINQYCNEKPGEANALLEFFKAQFPSVRNIHVPSTSSSGRKSNASTLEMFEQDMYSSICKEMCDNVPNEYLMKEGGYSAAEGGLESSRLAESVLFAKYVSALSMEMQENPSPFEASSGNRTGIESTLQPVAYGGFGPTDCDGIHLSSCGHAVHQGCLERYLSLSKERCNRRIILEGGHIVDPDQGEFLCPLCRQLANSVLPVLSGDLQKVKQPLILSSGSSFVGNSFLPVEKNNSLWLHQALLLLQSAANVVGKGVLIESFPQQRNEKMASSLDLVSHVIGKMYFHNKQNSFIGSARVGHPMIMWDTLKYTLMSMDIAARCERTSLTPIYDINALYKELKSSRVFVLSLLLKVVQSMRSRDSLHVLQRFVGVQLFAESICSGVSRDYSNIACEGGGNISSIVKNADTEVSYPDIKFWNWASDPVLAHDPFSSLMWVLFCLPCPFISCKESVLSLVHMFYAVTIVQAVISYCGRPECKTDGIGFSECLITDISKLLGGFGSAREYFISNYVDPSCEVKDMIRKFSFPFLRRCALLWKLLNSTASAPFSDRDDMFDQSFHDIMDSYDGALGDLNEIQKLEKLFKIPPLDFLLEDEVLRTLVHKWFHHFCKKFEVHGFQTVLYSNPAVPLKLMQLPHLYQDLLQRYVKQRCPDCKSVLHEPALCLLCGRLCSPSWKSCCRESECQTHAQNCGAGTGVFLLIRITTILLQRCSLQTPWPSPYLDAYGEEDIGMHRGKPLFLNEERYAVLTYMVATHGLDRSSKVLDQTTIEGFFLV